MQPLQSYFSSTSTPTITQYFPSNIDEKIKRIEHKRKEEQPLEFNSGHYYVQLKSVSSKKNCSFKLVEKDSGQFTVYNFPPETFTEELQQLLWDQPKLETLSFDNELFFTREQLQHFIHLDPLLKNSDLKFYLAGCINSHFFELISSTEPIPLLIKKILRNDLSNVANSDATNNQLNTADFRGFTPLNWAINLGHLSIAEELINQGACINLSDYKMVIFNEMVHFYHLLAVCVSPTKIILSKGTTLLHYAAWTGSTLLIKELLKLFPIDILDDLGSTPLYNATSKNHIATSQALLEHHANPFRENFRGMSPFLKACEKNFTGLAKLFLYSCPLGASSYDDRVNRPNKEGTTALWYALANKNSELVKLLLNFGANPHQCKNEYTPLHYAVKEGLEEIVNILLFIGKANVDFKVDRSLTLLDIGASVGNINIVRALVKAGCNPHVGAPVAAAAYSKNLLMIDFLVKEFQCSVDAPNKSTNSPLYIAAIKGYVEIVEALLFHGAEPNPISEDHPLIYFIKTHKLKNYKLVLLKIEKKLFENNRLDYIALQHLIYTKYLSHVFSLKGIAKIQGQLYLWEGFRHESTTKLLATYIVEFQKNYPAYMSCEVAEVIAKSLHMDPEYRNTNSIMQKLKQKKPVAILTGYIGHCVGIYLWNNTIIICNRGSETQKPLSIGHFNPDLLTKDKVDYLLKLCNLSNEEYKLALNNGNNSTFLKSIEFKTNKSDSILEKFCSKPFQTSGNCSFSNVEGLIKPIHLLLILYKSQKNNELKDNFTILAEANRNIENFEYYVRMRVLEKYILKTIKKNKKGYSPMPPIIDHENPVVLESFNALHLIRQSMPNYIERSIKERIDIILSYIKPTPVITT